MSESRIKSDPLWYKDAVIYELHVKSFSDSNEDGIGDFRGLIGKLPYLKSLGITALWLLPFYKSPLKDDGYDISDYYEIHPDYGTLSDFREFLRQAHKLGIRVITELVINHTSDQHPWFQRARKARPRSKHRNYYVWSDTPDKYSEARIIFPDFENSNWSWDPVAKSYYWHRFYSHQPDLNYESPAVQKEIIKVIDFWFEMGVDGMRIDAIPYLYEQEGTNCENLPQTHAFIKKLRAHVDSKYGDKMFLCEANQWPEDAHAYFGNGDECHMAFNFPLMPRLFMSLWMEESFPILEILEQTPPVPDACQWAIFLRNHDELTLEMVTEEERDYMYRIYARDMRSRINMGIRRRLAPLLDNNRSKMELMNMLLFSLPGTPIIYYGDEIGMGDNYYLGDRNGVRTPMQWSPDKSAGFSAAHPHKLYLPVIIDPEYHYEAVNVENQERNSSSMLWWMKRVIHLRKKFRVFGRGSFEIVQSDNSKVLSFIREYDGEIVLVVANLSRFTQVVNLNLSGYKGYTPVELFGGTEFPVITESSYMMTPGFHHCYWFVLRRKEEDSQSAETSVAHIKSNLASEDFLKSENIYLIEKYIYKYLFKCRWFGGKSKRVRDVGIADILPLCCGNEAARMLFVSVDYANDPCETYVFPVVFVDEEKCLKTVADISAAAIVFVEGADKKGYVIDAVHHPDFRKGFVKLFTKKAKKMRAQIEILPWKTRGRKGLKLEESDISDSRVVGTQQSNTSIIYSNKYFLKLFRKLEEGVNPDVEIGKFMLAANFPNVPRFLSSLGICRGGKHFADIAILQEFTPNQGDFWSFTLEEVSRFYEKVFMNKDKLEIPKEVKSFEFDLKTSPALEDFFGISYPSLVSLLGKRTAELHKTLSSGTGDRNFTPESFSKLYQRSLYQSMAASLKKTMLFLSCGTSKFPRETQQDIKFLLESKNHLLKIYSALLTERFHAKRIRIHGDYHLGQVLFTGKDFMVIDFEGEPARTLSERKIKQF